MTCSYSGENQPATEKEKAEQKFLRCLGTIFDISKSFKEASGYFIFTVPVLPVFPLTRQPTNVKTICAYTVPVRTESTDIIF
jgi:hypothetical protein